jgi:hypothetical protein
MVKSKAKVQAPMKSAPVKTPPVQTD